MMSLKGYGEEKLAKMSLIELTKLVMLEEKKPMKFNEAFERVATLKDLTDEQKQSKIGQYYTDLNVDGSFVANGSNTWGLKRWYRSNEKEEEVKETPRKVVRKKKQIKDDEDIDIELSMIDENIDEFSDDLDYDDEDDGFDIEI